MKLWVKYGKRNKPFRPHLHLSSTGFCPAGHWCGQFFRPEVLCGLDMTIINTPDVKDALAHYLSELKRCGHVEVKVDES
jgi:hypothetical protein